MRKIVAVTKYGFCTAVIMLLISLTFFWKQAILTRKVLNTSSVRGSLCTSPEETAELRPTGDNSELRHKLNTRQMRFGGFQLASDGETFIYSGYYDNRSSMALVKVVALLPKNISHNYTCVLEYPDGVFKWVFGYAELENPLALRSFIHIFPYRNGFVMCQVPKDMSSPTFLSVHRENEVKTGNNITVWRPQSKRYNLTRCVKSFIKNFSNVEQLVWNLELNKIFGVQKSIIYLESQTEAIIEALRSYEQDGMVEIRNFSLPSPTSELKRYMNKEEHWGQQSAYHECLFSQVGLSKYVLFHDFDEVIVPKVHKNLVEMADDLVNRTENGPRPASALVFQNIFYSTFSGQTKMDFPLKSVAERYKIDPLLYTTRFKMNGVTAYSKMIVIPERIDQLFIHYPEKSHPGYHTKFVAPDVAHQCHYRGKKNNYMKEPETEDFFMEGYAFQLATAVRNRFEKIKGR